MARVRLVNEGTMWKADQGSEGGRRGRGAGGGCADEVSEGEPGEEVSPVSAEAKWGIKPVKGRAR